MSVVKTEELKHVLQDCLYGFKHTKASLDVSASPHAAR